MVVVGLKEEAAAVELVLIVRGRKTSLSFHFNMKKSVCVESSSWLESSLGHTKTVEKKDFEAEGEREAERRKAEIFLIRTNRDSNCRSPLTKQEFISKHSLIQQPIRIHKKIICPFFYHICWAEFLKKGLVELRNPEFLTRSDKTTALRLRNHKVKKIKQLNSFKSHWKFTFFAAIKKTFNLFSIALNSFWHSRKISEKLIFPCKYF